MFEILQGKAGWEWRFQDVHYCKMTRIDLVPTVTHTSVISFFSVTT